MNIKSMTKEELAAAKLQARRFLWRSGHGGAVCGNCGGSGWLFTGEGHYGDQTGDAGQLKAVTNRCPQCDGTGEVDA